MAAWNRVGTESESGVNQSRRPGRARRLAVLALRKWFRLDRDSPLWRASAQAEREAILQVLEETGWNITRAAKHLGLSRYGLQLKMRRLGLERPGSP